MTVPLGFHFAGTIYFNHHNLFFFNIFTWPGSFGLDLDSYHFPPKNLKTIDFAKTWMHYKTNIEVITKMKTNKSWRWFSQTKKNHNYEDNIQSRSWEFVPVHFNHNTANFRPLFMKIYMYVYILYTKKYVPKNPKFSQILDLA